MAMLNEDAEPLVKGGGNSGIDSDDESHSNSSTLAGKLHPRKSRRLACLQSIKWPITVVIVVAIIAVTWALLSITSRDKQKLRQVPTPDGSLPPLCGNSPEEASALGCTFDVYINGWVPAACYDRSVAADSESNSSVLAPGLAGSRVFPIYHDADFTQPATMEELQKAAFVNQEEGEDLVFYTTYGYHRAHCVHLWRLSASAIERKSNGALGIGVYYKVASFAHAVHCNEVLLKYDKDPRAVDTIIPGVCRCVGLDDIWNQSYGWGGRPRQMATASS